MNYKASYTDENVFQMLNNTIETHMNLTFSRMPKSYNKKFA